MYERIERFDAEGPDGLRDRERDGRPRKADDEADAESLRVLDGDPTDEGYKFSRWTVPRLTEHLRRELGTRTTCARHSTGSGSVTPTRAAS